MKRGKLGAIILFSTMLAGTVVPTVSHADEWIANTPQQIDIQEGQSSYTFKKGDTIWATVEKLKTLNYKTTVEEFSKLNNVDLSKGEERLIPIGRQFSFDTAKNTLTVQDSNGEVVSQTVVDPDNKVNANKPAGETVNKDEIAKSEKNDPNSTVAGGTQSSEITGSKTNEDTSKSSDTESKGTTESSTQPSTEVSQSSADSSTKPSTSETKGSEESSTKPSSDESKGSSESSTVPSTEESKETSEPSTESSSDNTSGSSESSSESSTEVTTNETQESTQTSTEPSSEETSSSSSESSTVPSSTDQSTSESTTPPKPEKPDNVVLGAPFISQGNTMLCEGTSLLQALHFKGIATSQDLMTFVKTMPLSSNNNPNNGFSGEWRHNVDGTYQGMNPTPIVQWGNANGGNVVDISGSGVDVLKDEVANGNPVVVWVTYAFESAEHKQMFWGDAIWNRHVVTLDGYRDGSYHVVDPVFGASWINANAFETAYNVSRLAVTVR